MTEIKINSKPEGNIDENIYYRTVKGFSNRPNFKRKYYNKSHEIHKGKMLFLPAKRSFLQQKDQIYYS